MARAKNNRFRIVVYSEVSAIISWSLLKTIELTVTL